MDESGKSGRFHLSPFRKKGGKVLQDSILQDLSSFLQVAEREGFEPPVQLPVHRISSAARSTTPASLLSAGGIARHKDNVLYRLLFVRTQKPRLSLTRQNPVA